MKHMYIPHSPEDSAAISMQTAVWALLSGLEKQPTCSVAVKAPDLSTSFSFRQSASLVLTTGGKLLAAFSQLPMATKMLLLTSSFASSLPADMTYSERLCKYRCTAHQYTKTVIITAGSC